MARTIIDYKDVVAFQSTRERNDRASDEAKAANLTKASEEFIASRKFHIEEKDVAVHLRHVIKHSAKGIIMKMHPLTDGGIPDYIVHVQGLTFYVETKTTNKVCTPIQIEQHKRIYTETGIMTYVLDVNVYSLQDVWDMGYTTYPCDTPQWRRSPHNPKRTYEIEVAVSPVLVSEDEKFLEPPKTFAEARSDPQRRWTTTINAHRAAVTAYKRVCVYRAVTGSGKKYCRLGQHCKASTCTGTAEFLKGFKLLNDPDDSVKRKPKRDSNQHT